MKKTLIALITAVLLSVSLAAGFLFASAANTYEDKNLGLIDVTVEENVSDVKGTAVSDVGNTESARRVMGKGDTFTISAEFGPSAENKNAYLRVEAEGNRVIEISTDEGATWTTIGEKDATGATVYGANVRGEDHRGTEDSQVTFYDISDFVPVDTGANVRIRFSTPADAERDGAIFWNCKIFRAPTYDFSDNNMTEVVDVKSESSFFDMHRTQIFDDGPRATNNYGFYMFRVTFPAGAEDAHLITELGHDNRQISLIKEDGSAEIKLGADSMDTTNKTMGALMNVGPNEWGEGLLTYSLKDYLNEDGSATTFIVKMRPENLGQSEGPLTKHLQFSYTKEIATSSMLKNAGIEDVVNVYELRKDNNTESDYYVYDDGVSNQPENNTYYDGNAYAVYRLPYKAGVQQAVLRAKIRGYYRLSVSADGESWTDIAIGDIMTGDGTGPSQADTFFDVTAFTDKAKDGYVYVRFADNTTTRGFGPKWEKLGLDCYYGDKALQFTGNSITVDVSDDMQIQDRWGAAYTADGAHRFADGEYYFTYKVDVSSGVNALYMRAMVGGANRKIDISVDGGNTWTTIDDAKQNISADASKSDGSYYDLTEYIKDADAILVRFGCNDVGSGSDLNALEFVRNADFSEVVGGGHMLDFTNGDEASVHVQDESLMWELNGTASQETSYGGGWHRFADTTSYFTYKIKFPATAKTDVFMQVDIQGSNRHIEVSLDGEVWTDLSYVGINNNDPLYGADLLSGRYSYFRLDDYLNDTDTLFIRFSAYNESQGNGADVYSNIYFLFGEEIVNGKGELELGKNMVQSVNLSDSTLLAEDNGSEFGRSGDDIYRRANGTNSFTYKLQFPSNTEFAYIMARMTNTAGMYIRVSTDGSTYRDLCYVGMDDYNGASYVNGERYYFSLDRYLNTTETKEIWLQFASYNGNAAGTELKELIVFYNKPFNSEATYPSNPMVEEQTIIAGDAGEEGYYQADMSVGDHSTNFDGDGFRFYDAASYGVYKFTYNGTPSVLKLVIEVRGGYRVSVSADGSDWTDILISDINYAPEGAPLQNRAYFDFNITEFLNDNKTIYVKVGDSTDWHGWGGAFSRITLLAVSEGSQVAKEPIFGEGELAKQIKLQDAAFIEAENGSTFEFTGRGVKGADAYFTYKFNLADDATSFFIAFNYQNQIKVEVSVDGTTFATVPDANILSSEYGKGSAVTYNLAYLLENGKTIYVRFSDGNLSDDYASILMSLYAGYNSAALSDSGKVYENQTHDTFIVGTQQETDHIVHMDTSNVENRWEYRKIQKNATAVYKFSYEESAEHLKLILSIGGTFQISVSTDGVNFTDVLVSTSQYYAQSGVEEDNFYATVAEYMVDISSFMENNAAREIYVRVADPIDDNDFGVQLVGMGVIGMSGDEVVTETPDDGNTNEPSENAGCGASVGAGIAGLSLAVISLAVVIVARKRNGRA